MPEPHAASIDLLALREAAEDSAGIPASREGDLARGVLHLLDERDLLYAEIERLGKSESALLPLAWALEDDERHGNLTGRAEDAWEAYKYDR